MPLAKMTSATSRHNNRAAIAEAEIGVADAAQLARQIIRGLEEQELLLHRDSLMPEEADGGVVSRSA